LANDRRARPNGRNAVSTSLLGAGVPGEVMSSDALRNSGSSHDDAGASTFDAQNDPVRNESGYTRDK
jgi:hypothetical protein